MRNNSFSGETAGYGRSGSGDNLDSASVPQIQFNPLQPSFIATNQSNENGMFAMDPNANLYNPVGADMVLNDTLSQFTNSTSLNTSGVSGHWGSGVNSGANPLHGSNLGSRTSGQPFMQNPQISQQDKEMILKYIDDLKYAQLRDNALLELSRQRDHFQELAPFIWHSTGTIAALLQEIVSVYPLLSPPELDNKTSNKACNVLALLQCVASHKDTRYLFLKANIHFYTFPFLNTVCKGRAFEYLRLTSLGVIGALVKVDDPKVIDFLLKTEIIPLCLRIMERGTELSQTVATFIIQKILLDDEGLKYLCGRPERFYAVSSVLDFMVESQLQKPSQRLLKHIIKCYFRLSDNQKALMALVGRVPTIVKEKRNPQSRLCESLDESSKKLLQSLGETIQKQQHMPVDQLNASSFLQHSPDGQGMNLHGSIPRQMHQQQNQNMYRAQTAPQSLQNSQGPFNVYSAHFNPSVSPPHQNQNNLKLSPQNNNNLNNQNNLSQAQQFYKSGQNSPGNQSQSPPPPGNWGVQRGSASSGMAPPNLTFQPNAPNFLPQPSQQQMTGFNGNFNSTAFIPSNQTAGGRQSPTQGYAGNQYGFQP